MSRVAIRNTAIVAGIAALVFLSQTTFSAFAISINQIIFILMIAGLAVFAYQYFKENQLAWLVFKPWQRQALIGCAIAIALLLLVGFPLLGPVIGSLGVLALIIALGVAIFLIIQDSRKL
jgi:hypothetical protein